ncbi:hypothetical protein [Antarcticirhabdus aurantiaca]|uniref:Uncharacterized protein n=1 Tax=Antarcticirhabdus aurantiaca TaxID=2606717 RepID=A0ACD4NM87_9HYPH|nr:hypothetical protein [Antarcticirhabdus aurantiaca]WAJ28030.1 hypothetical protein OXU80_24915 [Jeongeuplla avenae]
MAEAQAQAYERQTVANQRAAGYEAMQEHRRSALAQSAARAQVGASGVGFQGSPGAVLSANAEQSQLDIDAILWNSKVNTTALKTQAGISRMQGRQARQASYLGAAGAVVGGISDMYDISSRQKARAGLSAGVTPRPGIYLGMNQFA